MRAAMESFCIRIAHSLLFLVILFYVSIDNNTNKKNENHNLHVYTPNSSIIRTRPVFLLPFGSIRSGCVINILMFDAHVTNPHTQKDLLHSNRVVVLRQSQKEATCSFHITYFILRTKSFHTCHEQRGHRNKNNDDNDVDSTRDQKIIA